MKNTWQLGVIGLALAGVVTLAHDTTSTSVASLGIEDPVAEPESRIDPSGIPTTPDPPTTLRVALPSGVTLLPQPVTEIAKPQVRSTVHRVTVNADGTFSPMWTYIRDGDTVEWVFSEPTDSVIPASVQTSPTPALVPKPYDPTDLNEFTGPLPLNPSGVFALGPVNNDGVGLHQVDAATWASSGITGVFLRPKWNDVHLGPGQFDWTALDQELDQAVAHGKLFSISFKAGKHGTPDWIFSTDADGTPRLGGGGGVTRHHFQDGGSNLEPGKCGTPMDLGDPTDPTYQAHYFALLRAFAQHLASRADWYRSLAYFKPSGANLFSHENRLPKRNELGCYPNTEVWSQAGYTPSGLYEFYSRQTALVASLFPNKGLSYMLIQAGFPLVNEQGDYLLPDGTSSGGTLPGGVEQTKEILDQGQADHGLAFVVQHNGLGPTHTPNIHVTREGSEGQVTGFQTQNMSKIADTATLDQTLTNAWDNTEAVFVEVYQALITESVLDPAAVTPRTLGDWSELFHTRRRDLFPTLDDPFPMKHNHRFTRTIPTAGNQIFHYVHGSKRGALNYGAIVITD